ncbi:MAG: peptide chain release factor 1 [Acholeplasmataceae bacterium]|nr:peptide chain release factor 1 [Acholeplasmataceae bacterium]MDD4203769.1 peptide chain release factor 1 [Acholeplasmataceae bacterium]MDD4468476.1 peptide chain release factor 1 [Acholeplasmataceae bacterium]MDD4824343.1 peptide chain release factor 1 [Acholeplasmataceae bacterium]
MFDRLELMEKRYKEINNSLMDSKVVSNVKEMTKLMKEQKGLERVVIKYRDYIDKESQLKELKALLHDDDEEISSMAELESESLQEAMEKLEEELKILLLPKDPNDEKNVIVEIKGAAGGDEGNIFAGDLFKMYSKFAESQGWKIEVLSATEGAMGGFTSIEFLISGDHVYSMLKYEAGVHRVQRVPETESQGRIHTSTATVIVMPEAEEVEINISWNDIRFDTFNSSGPGGQSVNTTYSAVRLTHIPTGIAVASQEGKSQHENKDKAYRLLVTRIYDQYLQEQAEKEGEARLSMVGKGSRSEKIRTYNYPQNRVSDHRINLTVQRLDAIMEGKLELILEPLQNEIQKRKLEAGEAYDL